MNILNNNIIQKYFSDILFFSYERNSKKHFEAENSYFKNNILRIINTDNNYLYSKRNDSYLYMNLLKENLGFFYKLLNKNDISISNIPDYKIYSFLENQKLDFDQALKERMNENDKLKEKVVTRDKCIEDLKNKQSKNLDEIDNKNNENDNLREKLVKRDKYIEDL